MSKVTFAEAINLALKHEMQKDSSVLCYGLGVDDPKRIFNTTVDLAESFSNRVFDMPTSENAMLGIGVGAAINGMKPVMVHQRLDFFLLAMDQLVNSAAKWNFMFGGRRSVPIVIRLVIGRGWGQGPTHSQDLQAWFAHVPGLKVVTPSTTQSAYDLLRASIQDPNPVVFLEHRWLHAQEGELDTTKHAKLGSANVIREGKDITIVSSAYTAIEALRAAQALKENGVDAEVVDLQTISPLDWDTVEVSLEKTRRLLVLDTASRFGGVAGEILAQMSEKFFLKLLAAPARLAMPSYPQATSYALTKDYYYGAEDIAQKAHEIVTSQQVVDMYQDLKKQGHHDVPGDYFKGPF